MKRLVLIAFLAPGLAAYAQETPLPPPSSQPAPPPAPAPITVVSGAAGKNYLNVSVDVLIAVGASTEPDVAGLELRRHHPAQRGVTLQNLQLGLDGVVDL